MEYVEGKDMTKKISQILKESTVPQINGSLIGYTTLAHDVVGKCALGVLACESGNPDLKLDMDNRGFLGGFPITHRILQAYDVPPEYLDITNPILPSISFVKYNHDAPPMPHISWDSPTTLSYMILNLNDKGGLTLKEIGEFLEVTFNL